MISKFGIFVFLLIVSHQIRTRLSSKEINQVDVWLSQLTLDEKLTLLAGSLNSHGYTGYLPGIPRLGIPSLRMNDGPQGFRGPKMTSTAWPCGLSLATTFSPEMVEQVALKLGKEFVMKGANVVLAPGMNLARVPENGRAFEYLCGEDPYLGEVMARSFVKGVQSNSGLIATAKHFVNNDQETHRGSVSSIVDEETEWNMYYRPFISAVKAGVQSVMCSYNKINGEYGCASFETIKDALEKQMNFSGFVVSDWFAVKDTLSSVKGGLDVEMPIPLHFGAELKSAVLSGKVTKETIDEKVRRVLNVISRNKVLNETKHATPKVNTSNEEHSKLARLVAANSIVLLKNDNSILPISKTTGKKLEILVVGDRGHDNVLSTGGGSGHVQPPYVISPFDGLRWNAPLHSFKYFNTIETFRLTRETIQKADVIFIVVGLKSTEGFDRKSLSLEPDDLQLIDFISKYSHKTVVSITAPGAIRIPFVNSVSAVLLQFMPGQEAGNALADVVYGIVDPGGARLPITIPFIENEQQMTESQYPGINFEAKYSEKSEIGYRWYSTHPEVSPHYPFGYGMSYAVEIRCLGVQLHESKDKNIEVHVGLLNPSKRVGVVVPQVYITSFPDEVKEVIAPIALVGFQRVILNPNEIQTVQVTVARSSFAVWTTKKKKYHIFDGTYLLSIGNSSSNFWTTFKVKF